MEKKFNFRHRIAEEIRIFKNVTAHTLTTKLQLEKLRELYRLDPHNVEVIPPGVDVHTYKPLQAHESRVPTKLPEPYIFCLSRIDTNKGHDLLLHAFARVLEAEPEMNLVIGGGSPNPRERERGVIRRMHEIVAEHGMEKRVHIIGYVPDELMAPYYRQAVMFVLPSLFEPFGMTSLEAMACGVPVVASKFGGIRNVINSGENGLLVNPEDPQEFSAAILKILRDQELASQLGHEGYKTIQKHYSWEAIARRHLEFYGEYMELS
jgi:mannosylfructose-phosphate synthase